MLHNTGPFGPNETPINPSGQANMSDMTGQMNISNITNNLTKIGPQSSHPVNSHFNLPDYANYGLNMNAAMNNFHNFHQSGYQQSLMHNASNSWQNSMLPMNLNAQSDPHSVLGYYEKKFEPQNEISEQNFNKSMLNIPQVYTKALHKHLGMDTHSDYYNINNFNNYIDHNLDLCVRSQKTDSPNALDRLSLQQKSRIPPFPEQVDLSRTKTLENQSTSVRNLLENQLSSRNMLHQKLDRPDYPYQYDLSHKPKSQDYHNIDARMSTHQKSPPFYSQHQERLPPKGIETNVNSGNPHEMPSFTEQIDLSRKNVDPNSISSLQLQKDRPYYSEEVDLSSRSKNNDSHVTSSQQVKSDKLPYYDQIDFSRIKDISTQSQKHDKVLFYDQVDSSHSKNITTDRLNLEPSNLEETPVESPKPPKTDDPEEIALKPTGDSIENNPQKGVESVQMEIEKDVIQNMLNENEKPKSPNPVKEIEKDTNVNLDLTTKPQEPPKDSLENRPVPNYSNEQRRRNLANTVRMIENILIQTTKKKETETVNTDVNPNDDDKIDEQSKDDDSQSIQSVDHLSDDHSISSTDANENDTSNYDDNSGKITLKDIKQECLSEPETDFVNIKKEKIDDVVVKVEISPDFIDMDNLNPFQKDSFGVHSEEVGNSEVHDAENSIAIALYTIKNETRQNDCYYECPHCSLYFSHPKRFLIHTKWHSFGLTNEKRMEFQRDKLMRKTMRREAKVLERMHQNEVTEVEKVAGKTYTCGECGKVFLKKASLQNHRQRYHPTRPRECKICGKLLVGWSQLRDHHLTHFSEAGYYQCDDCPKRFKYSHSLAKHRDTHLEKTHGCPKCTKMFGSAALLNVHLKTHERMLRGATFRCTYCGKGFFESYHLQAHERTHRNERPFGCEFCKTAFGTKSGLARHLRVSHSSAKPWECSTCRRSFVSEGIRDRHEMRNHGNPEDFKFVCKQCPCRYMKMKDLRKHVYKVHPKGRRKKKSESDTD